jgi:outer membrane immunogenic protein
MKVVFLTAASFLSLTSVSLAADYIAAPPADHQPQETMQWSGFYVGGAIGAGAVIHQFDIPALGGVSLNGLGGEGIFGELTAGYDWRFGNRMLAGVSANARYGGIKSSLSTPGPNADVTLDYGFDVIGRVGTLVGPSTLAYVLGGYTYQHFDIGTNAGFSYDWGGHGFVVGAGMETAISKRMTVKLEYRYSQFGAETIALGNPAGANFQNTIDVTPSTHTAIFGVNYRFGGGSAREAASFAEINPDWSGFFVSGGIGAGGLVHELSIAGGSLNGIGAEGVFGSLGAGYDQELGYDIVVGVEASAYLSSISSTLSAPGVSGSIDQQYNYDIVGRIGFKLNESAMLYGLAGYSRAHFDVSSSAAGSVYDWDANGYVLGAGIETALTDHVFAGLEYRYRQYEDQDILGAGVASVAPSMHTGQLNIKYKF